MITKDLIISKLLKEYPNSLNVLLNVSPHFNKLQNKLLRKALAGRVTIEQAASIAGVDLNALLAKLNNSEPAINENGKGSPISSQLQNKKPDFLNTLADEKIVTFDVRPILDAGKDPLKDILSKTKNLNLGETLLIINSFEPIPLYTLLEKKGFTHFTEKENDIFKVYFRKNKETQMKSNPDKLTEANDTVIQFNEKNFGNIIDIDVSQLQPPEPMLKILENLNRIDENTVMRIYHHREPLLLYPRLEERGYQASCKKLGEDNYKILIRKKRS